MGFTITTTARRSWHVALALTCVSAGLIFAPSPASAATNDSFFVTTTGLQCGAANFVDYGPGAAGGGNNDDYFTIKDQCSDGAGVKAYAWRNGRYLGSRYNGNGALSTVVWDPLGNVAGGESIGLKVCLSDGNNDPTPFLCAERTRTSADG